MRPGLDEAAGRLVELRPDLVVAARCFMCECFIPPGRDPVCTKCLHELEDWE
jgi:hypothetical protein